MSNQIKILIDTDVLISSLLSETGAAHWILNNEIDIAIFSSDLILTEVEKIRSRLGIANTISNKVFNNILQVTPNQLSHYKNYVYDINDRHVVASADLTNVQYLITYNIKDYNTDKISKDLNIIILTPGNFLQYLRLKRII